MKVFQLIVRSILSVILLWQVWFHSHWSVALSITLICITLELFAYAVRGLIKIMKEGLNL
jgi:hypothetical protein